MNRYDVQDPDHLDQILLEYSQQDEKYQNMVQLYENCIMERDERDQDLRKALLWVFLLVFLVGAATGAIITYASIHG